jgi:Ca2+-binding RTX toxin-like protein
LIDIIFYEESSMAILLVPSQYATIAQAMLSSAPGDSILLEGGYKNETATVSVNNITIGGDASSTGIVLHLASGVPLFALTGTAPISIFDAADGNAITGNSGNNLVTVAAGVDAVNGGLGTDRLFVDYRLATGAVVGDSTSNFTESGGGGRSVTITDGTFEHFTVLTGASADTITTGAGDDIVRAGGGANTITVGQGRNIVTGGSGADTITALDGGNCIDAGNGANTVTTGDGNDTVYSGTGADTITTGGGTDVITVRGGADTIVAGDGNDRMIVNYSALTTAVVASASGSVAAGYVGNIADGGLNTITFTGVENFSITTGSGNDLIATGYGNDVLNGGAGNDSLIGSGGQDKLSGNNGADVLTGGLGADVLTGGGGADHFRFVTRFDSPNNAQRDHITDFQQGSDKLNLSAIDADSTVGGNQAFDFLGTSAFTGAAGEVRYSQVGGNTLVSADVDGNMTVDFVFQLDGLYTLSGTDFVL